MTDVDQSAYQRLEHATERLIDWLLVNGIAGWDPYDLLGDERYRRLVETRRTRTGSRPLIARLIRAGAYRAPLLTRRVFGVRPSVNAKGVGLLLAAWTRLGTRGDERAAAQTDMLARWLVTRAESRYPGASWGYPFDWQSRVFIPKGTPSAVVTSVCGQALLDHAEATGDEPSLAAAHGAAVFLATGLNRYEAPDGSVCLSYTPIDEFRVHNASLMAGEYLLRAAARFGRADWKDLSLRIARYSLADQADDGSFEYWGPGQRESSQIDNYHTGFVLRSLASYAAAETPGAQEALERGWRYYASRFFGDDGRPLDVGGRTVPLNIHSCAESILCPAVLDARIPGARAIGLGAGLWTVDNMQNPDGSFAYMLRTSGIDRTPYLRWGQAWMLRALVEALAVLKPDSSSE